MRPSLKPALRRVWRDPVTLQIGLDPERAVILSGLDDPAARFVASLDGTRERAAVVEAAPEVGLDRNTAAELLDLLEAEGVLDDAATDTRQLFALRADERKRLRPDLNSLSVLHKLTDGGMQALARRRAAVIHVHGAGRVGAPLASLLAAAGIGKVSVSDASLTRHADLAPGGLTADDVGARREEGVRRAIARAGAGTAALTASPRELPQLAVLAPVGPLDGRLRDHLLRHSVAHLYAGIREITGLVGPLVVPGRSSCLRCHDLHRTDRDPRWPRVAAQLATGSGSTAACDTVLAVTVAAHAALQALAYVDGGRPSAVDGTVEIGLPDGRVRRRSWTPHPACGCGWAQSA